MQELKLAVHAHPTLSEVLDELFKAAKVHIYPFSTECLEKFWGTTLNSCEPHAFSFQQVNSGVSVNELVAA
jgi:hypothetical protein